MTNSERFELQPDNDVEVNKILEEIAQDNGHWGIVMQRPGMRIQHDGTYIHFVITIAKKPDTVCLSVGTTFRTQTHIKRFVHYIN
jgi:hypothetical protein